MSLRKREKGISLFFYKKFKMKDKILKVVSENPGLSRKAVSREVKKLSNSYFQPEFDKAFDKLVRQTKIVMRYGGNYFPQTHETV